MEVAAVNVLQDFLGTRQWKAGRKQDTVPWLEQLCNERGKNHENLALPDAPSTQ